MKSDEILLEGRKALVTGGTRGLGRAIAESLARSGASVVITGRQSDIAQRVAEELKAATGADVRGIGADVSRVPSAQQAVNSAATLMGGLDILVNNAGVAITRWAIELSEEEWDTVVDTNLKGLFFTSQAAARYMRAHDGGVIINVASVAGFRGERALSAYCAAKAGVINLTRALALEWARFGIRVVAVAPGYVETDLNRDVLANPRFRQYVLGHTPLGRLGLPAEVGTAVVFLASSAASYITGAVLPVDGGWLST